MNIKSIIHIPETVELQRPEARVKEMKTGESSDRDPNGRRDPEEQERRELTQEELDELQGQIRNLPGVKEHGLLVKIEVQNGTRILLIEEPNGQVVRRIPESEFLPLLKRQRQQTGQILNKAV